MTEMNIEQSSFIVHAFLDSPDGTLEGVSGKSFYVTELGSDDEKNLESYLKEEATELKNIGRQSIHFRMILSADTLRSALKGGRFSATMVEAAERLRKENAA